MSRYVNNSLSYNNAPEQKPKESMYFDIFWTCVFVLLSKAPVEVIQMWDIPVSHI